MRTALIAGATGLIGGKLLTALSQCDEYNKVICLSRRPLDFGHLGINHDKIINLVVNFNELSETKDIPECDDAFCCLGTTIRTAGSKAAFRKVDYDYCESFAKLANQHGTKHFLIVTAVGANSKSLVFYNRVKGEIEESLQSIRFDRLSIFQPSILLGSRSEKRLAEDIAKTLIPAFDAVLPGPLKRYHSITAKQVAEAMLNEACFNRQDPLRSTHYFRYKDMIIN